MRLFAALDLPVDVRTTLAAWAASAVGGDDRLRLVSDASLHVTLVFLGERPDADAAASALEAALSPAPPSPELSVAGPLWLSPRRPHVLTVGLEDDPGLTALHAGLWEALGARLGLEPARRRFRPHLTVARLRRGWPAPSRRLPDLGPRRLDAEAVVLFRSWLGRGPARYEPLARRPLS